MKIGAPVALFAGLLLAACSNGVSPSEEETAITPTPEKHFLVNSLVDRFDAPPCLDARPLKTRNISEGAREFNVRYFDAPADCAASLQASFEAVEFSKISKDLYAGQLSDGMEESIKFEPSQDGTRVGIEWRLQRI